MKVGKVGKDNSGYTFCCSYASGYWFLKKVFSFECLPGLPLPHAVVMSVMMCRVMCVDLWRHAPKISFDSSLLETSTCFCTSLDKSCRDLQPDSNGLQPAMALHPNSDGSLSMCDASTKRQAWQARSAKP